MLDTVKEIKSFEHLPKGWCYGSGVPVSVETIDVALDINEKAEDYGLKTEAFAGIDGEILLAVYGWEEDQLDITIFFSDIEYVWLKNEEPIDSEEFVSIDDIYELIDNLAKVDA
jgi:hypothetical protein